MNTSRSDTAYVSDDILALRRLVEQVAERCGLDLTDRVAVRRILDGDLSQCRVNESNLSFSQELPGMLTLLFRLESSSSEDLGISGLRRLWRQHSEILVRFKAGKLLQRASGPRLQEAR